MKQRRCLALAVLTLCLTGCGESPDAIFRRVLNGKNELIDSLMQVVDENSAKKFELEHGKRFEKLIADEKTKLFTWTQDNLWKHIKVDRKDPEVKKKSVDAAKKEILEAINDYVEAKFEYMKHENANKNRIDHEISRLNTVIARLQSDNKPVDKLQVLTNPKYFDKTVLGTILDTTDRSDLIWQFKYGPPPGPGELP